LGVRLRFVLLFAMGTASIRRGKKHDPDRNLGLSQPATFLSTNYWVHPQPEFNKCIGLVAAVDFALNEDG
jgi:hypothetical protein